MVNAPMNVLLLDPVPENTLNEFIAAGYNIQVAFGQISEAQLVKKLSECQIVCLARESDDIILTEEVLRSANRLLAIGFFGTLSNQIHLSTAQFMGIPVFTAPYQHQTSVCELIISYIVLLARQIGDRSKEIHVGEWNKTSNNCHEVRGKTLGIVGYGHVGSQLGVMAEALSLRVIFYDTVSIMPIGRAEPVATLDELLVESDFIALNITATKENEKLFGAAQFAKMKKNSYFINTSFGAAVDDVALAEAIKSGHLAGAALDTLPSAPTSKFQSPLIGLKNVILTPSIATKTFDSFTRIVEEVTGHIVRYVKEGTTTGAVNFPSIAPRKLAKGNCRIVCIHHNVRGVLREIDHILSSYNVGRQILDTKEKVGYLIADVKTENVSTEIVSQLAMLANTIRTRIL